MVHGRITDGARELRAFLDDKNLSVTQFCTMNRIDRIQVQRALNGWRQRFSVDFALAIEKATTGHVKMAKWASATARASRRSAA